MCIPLAVYCVIRRVRPTNSKFHPRSGFSPTKADLVKKDCNFVSKLQSFLVGEAGFGPAKSKTTDLQSAPFGRSGTSPLWSWRMESNPQPADYKSAALPIELRQHI